MPSLLARKSRKKRADVAPTGHCGLSHCLTSRFFQMRKVRLGKADMRNKHWQQCWIRIFFFSLFLPRQEKMKDVYCVSVPEIVVHTVNNMHYWLYDLEIHVRSLFCIFINLLPLTETLLHGKQTNKQTKNRSRSKAATACDDCLHRCFAFARLLSCSGGGFEGRLLNRRHC